MPTKNFGSLSDLTNRINRMKTHGIEAEWDGETLDQHQARALCEIVRAVRSVAFGSVEIVIQNSRIVQIERREKIRFDRS